VVAVFGRRPNIDKQLANQDVPALQQALAHQDPAVRRDAVLALAAISDPAAAAAAVRVLLEAARDKHEDVRIYAEVALDDPASPVIRRALVRHRRANDPTRTRHSR
jgi:HEAT repeat protein